MNSPRFPLLRRFGSVPILARFTVLSTALLVSSSCVSEPSAITGEKKSFGYSWEQEQQLGAEADKEITQQMGLYQDPPLQAYVEAIGQRVLQTSNLRGPDTPDLYRDAKFTFRVLDSPVVNAFALPGGYVYVTRGLLAHVQNEAQLAVVLGHEIAHVAARHSSQQARRAQLGQIGLVAGAILGQTMLGEQGGDLAQSLLQLGGQAFELLMLRYSREAEHESDTLGVGYASRAGYAAGESAKFFQSLQQISATEGRSLPTWQSTHPDPGDRAQRVLQLAAAQTPPGVTPVVAEEEYLRRLDGMIVGEDPHEGFTLNGVFYHPSLRFQFPVVSGWQVQNEKALVALVDPGRRGIMGFRIVPATNGREAAARFVQEAQVQVAHSGATTVNGLPATVVIGQANTPQGALGVWNAFIELEGRVYSFLGYSPAAVFTQLQPTFEAVAGGFGPLRDPNLANLQPTRLRVTRATQPAAFASFIPANPTGKLTPPAVAIMNQIGLNEVVAPGRLLKIPDPTMPAPAATAGVVVPAVANPAPAPVVVPAGTTPTVWPPRPAPTE